MRELPQRPLPPHHRQMTRTADGAAQQPMRLPREFHIQGGASLAILHRYQYQPLPLHWHEFYEVVFVLGGEGLHIVNGLARPLMQGSISLLTPADFHQVVSFHHSMLDYFNVEFTEDILEGELYQLLFMERQDYTQPITVSNFAATAANFHRLLAESSTRAIGQDLASRATMTCILVDLVRDNRRLRGCEPEQSVRSLQQTPIHKALVYIDHHFRESIRLENVASYVGLSANYFSERFHRATGSSFQSYLQGRRLHFAMSLLSAADLPVTDVCYSSGFNTLSHFERTFARHYGRSPGSIRRKKTGTDSHSAN